MQKLDDAQQQTLGSAIALGTGQLGIHTTFTPFAEHLDPEEG